MVNIHFQHLWLVDVHLRNHTSIGQMQSTILYNISCVCLPWATKQQTTFQKISKCCIENFAYLMQYLLYIGGSPLNLDYTWSSSDSDMSRIFSDFCDNTINFELVSVNVRYQILETLRAKNIVWCKCESAMYQRMKMKLCWGNLH